MSSVFHGLNRKHIYRFTIVIDELVEFILIAELHFAVREEIPFLYLPDLLVTMNLLLMSMGINYHFLIGVIFRIQIRKYMHCMPVIKPPNKTFPHVTLHVIFLRLFDPFSGHGSHRKNNFQFVKKAVIRHPMSNCFKSFRIILSFLIFMRFTLFQL